MRVYLTKNSLGKYVAITVDKITCLVEIDEDMTKVFLTDGSYIELEEPLYEVLHQIEAQKPKTKRL